MYCKSRHSVPTEANVESNLARSGGLFVFLNKKTIKTFLVEYFVSPRAAPGHLTGFGPV